MAVDSRGLVTWGYVIVASKMALLCVDGGTSKSFGVLIPVMVKRFEADYATVGLICSMPATLMYLCCPFVSLLLQRFNKRVVAMSGGLLTGLCLTACAFIRDTVPAGICLGLSGMGLSMAFLPMIITLNDYFPERFLFVNSLTTYGFVLGSMLFPIITERALEAYGYAGAFLILGAISLNAVACGATVRTPPQRDCSARRNELPDDSCNVHEGMDATDANEEQTAISAREGFLPTQDSARENNRSRLSCASIARSLSNFCNRSCGILNEWLFLFSLPAHLLTYYLLYAWVLFLVPHAQHLGIAPSNAVFLSTIGGVGGVLGHLALSLLLAKDLGVIEIFIANTIVGSICTISFLVDFVSTAFVFRAVLAFVQGFCLFFQDQLAIALTKHLTRDRDNFDVGVAISACIGGVGATCSGFFTGYLFDVTASFTKVFIIIGFIHAVVVGHMIIVIILKKLYP